jgi:hypothetical protein
MLKVSARPAENMVGGLYRSEGEHHMACPTCRARSLVEIGMNLGDNRITLHSCSKCDTRWWDQDGSKVPVDGVLALARR